jgi:hypothetical protein
MPKHTDKYKPVRYSYLSDRSRGSRGDSSTGQWNFFHNRSRRFQGWSMPDKYIKTVDFMGYIEEICPQLDQQVDVEIAYITLSIAYLDHVHKME